jgi:hypothetical protein
MRKGIVGGIGLALAALSLLPLPQWAATTPSSFKVLQSLVGDWVEVDAQGKPGNKVVSSFALTSGGTAIREVLFPGGDHEMITMYSLDGENLVLAHYCVLGNTPRYRARLENEKQLVYECQGGANIASENDRHMHRGSVIILGPDRIQTEWLQLENGKQSLKVSFDLVRKR